MKVVVLGHICIDKNTNGNLTYVGPGGPPFFISRVFKTLKNCSLTIISPYGHDGQKYFRKLNLYPKKPPARKTLIYENFFLNGKRVQKAYNRQQAQPINLTPQIKKIISQAEIFFLTPLLPNYSISYLQGVKELLKKNCLKILLPQGYFRAFSKENQVYQRNFIEAEAILPFFDFIICSNEDHQKIFSWVKIWTQKTKVIITLAENGAFFFCQRKKLFVPTQAVKKEEIINFIGAGDTFTAAFAYKYFLTGKLKKSLVFAHRLARQNLFCLPNQPLLLNPKDAFKIKSKSF